MFKSSSKRQNKPFCFNCLPNDKILDLYKLKAFSDDKIKKTEKLKFVLERIENILRKGENASNQHFSSFRTMFSTDFLCGVVKSRDYVV